MNLHPNVRVGNEVSYKGRTWTVVMRIPSIPAPNRTMLVLQCGERYTTEWIENGKLEREGAGR